MTIAIKEINTYSGIEELGPAWLELRQAAGDRWVCNHPAWIRANQFLPEVGSPLILAAFDGDTLIGLAPMCIKEERYRGIPLRRIEFISESATNDFLVRERREEVVRAMLDRLCAQGREKTWDVLELSRMGDEEANLGLIRETMKDHRLRPYEVEDFPHGTIKVDDWDTYIRRKSKKFREDVRRRARRLDELGEIRLLRYSGLEDEYDEPESREKLDRILRDAIECSRNSWQGKTTVGTAVSDEQAYHFFRELTHSFAAMDMLLFHVLYAGDVPIAFDLSFMEGQMLLDFKIGYHQEYRRAGPGAHLYRVVLEYASENGFEHVDQMSIEQGQEYKHRWVDELRATKRILVFNKTMNGSLARFVMQGLAPRVKRFLGKDGSQQVSA